MVVRVDVHGQESWACGTGGEVLSGRFAAAEALGKTKRLCIGDFN